MNKLKQTFERWLRALISDEVNHLDTSLQFEREALRSRIAAFDAQIVTLNIISAKLDAQLQTFAEAVKQLDQVKELDRIREDAKQMNTHVAGIVAAAKKLHPRA
jgi:ABC-type transporter Mla subunit MlaD